MTLYMAVTADKYELPIAVGTREEIARQMGVSRDTISAMLAPSHQGRDSRKQRKWKPVRLKLEDDFE